MKLRREAEAGRKLREAVATMGQIEDIVPGFRETVMISQRDEALSAYDEAVKKE